MVVPLFPLNTVLFPDGPLPLRIFEARYIDMVGRCMKEESPFGVVLQRDGSETNTSSYAVGTLATITDFFQGSDGLLGVTAIGQERFRVQSAERQKDGLLLGTVETIPPEPSFPLPQEFQSAADILDSILDDLGRLYESLARRLDDAVWVSYRFVEILPIDLEQKQASLESNDTHARLKLVTELLEHVRVMSTPQK